MTAEKKTLMQIGTVAKRAATTIRTVRYYLQLGLISETARSPGGFYLFDTDAVDRVRYICHLRELGLSLGDIQKLINIRRHSPVGAAASRGLRARLELQIRTIEQKIADFQQLKQEIAAAVQVLRQCADCDRKPGPSVCAACPVLHSLDDPPAPMKVVF